MGDFYKFSWADGAQTTTANQSINAFLAGLLPWLTNTTTTSSGSGSSSSQSANTVTLANFSSGFVNLPTILIGWNTPNYVNGFWNFGS
jgi:hypothetical protein